MGASQVMEVSQVMGVSFVLFTTGSISGGKRGSKSIFREILGVFGQESQNVCPNVGEKQNSVSKKMICLKNWAFSIMNSKKHRIS